MVKLKDESFVEKVLYRLVKRHVSGTTMSSALEKAKELNKKGMPVSITFLSGGAGSRSKSKYITSTYQELARQISRLGIRAGIQVPLAQMGPESDRGAMGGNLSSIIATGNKYGVFVWAEASDVSDCDFEGFDGCRGFGYAVPSSQISGFAKAHRGAKALKVVFADSEDAGEADRIARQLGSLPKNCTTVLLSPPDAVARKVLGSGRPGRQILEYKFGEGGKGMKRALKRGAKVSVYLPFGKDWQAYAMNKVPEGYTRFLAGKLLGERSGHGGI
ncbi:MAG: hypothetical protein M1354_00545 [Candidatus Marsarchaeota archaeon]|nr:hypothetical protein [Candidatus Marsarchaeota archaeon]